MKRLWQCILSGLLCVSVALAKEATVSDATLAEKLGEAEALQEARREAGPVESRVIKESPKAFLNAGTGDVSTTGDVQRGIHRPPVFTGRRMPVEFMLLCFALCVA